MVSSWSFHCFSSEHWAHDGGNTYTRPFAVQSLGSISIYTVGSMVVSAAEPALLSMTEVLYGPLWVWIFIGESVSILALAGGAILLLAIAGNALTGIRRKTIPVI